MNEYRPLSLIRENSMCEFVENVCRKLSIKDSISMDKNENRFIEHFYEGAAFIDSPNNPFNELQPAYTFFTERYNGNWKKCVVNFTQYVLSEAIEKLWVKNKQALIVDETFIDCMCLSQKISIPIDLAQHLPFDTFCLDLQNTKYFADTEYCFVHLQQKTIGNPGLLLSIIRVLKDNTFVVYAKEFSNIVSLSEGKRFIQYNFVPESKKSTIHIEKYLTKKEYERYKEIRFDNSQKDKLIHFCIQMFMYLYVSELDASKNIDIKQSEESKRFYKPTKEITNTINEINKWEVGFSVGKFIREHEQSSGNTSGDKHSVRPHFRCAHWKGVWHGSKAKPYLVPTWIHETYVNATDNSDIGVTLRKIG